MLAQLTARWSSVPQRARIGIAISVPIFIGVISLVFALLHPARVPLFSQQLSRAQMNEVETTLAGWNIPFTPVDTNIIVDASQRNALLLRLSLAGLPRNSIQSSRETLSQIGALTPESVIDAQTRDGLAGDIELALRGVDGIDDAQVIIAPAQRGDFADQRSADASASVRLHLRLGATLSREEHSGIARFVAAAIPGLQPQRVTILGDTGVVAGDHVGDDAAQLQLSAQSELDTVFGPGTTIVRVHITRDANSMTHTDVERSPLGALTYNGTSEQYTTAGKRYEKKTSSQENGTRVRRLEMHSSAGAVARLSVAVAVDAARHIELAAIRALVAASVGLDLRRGDIVVVEAVPFSHSREAPHDSWWLAYGVFVPLLPALALACAMVFVARYLASPFVHFVDRWNDRTAIVQAQQAVAGYSPVRVRQALKDEPAHAAAAIISALPTVTAAAVLELYPEAERRAILARMQRERSPLIPEADEIIAHA